MIRDVEYAFFAQLSYLNWNNLNLNEIIGYKQYKNKDLIGFLKLTEVWNEIKINDIEPKVENGILNISTKKGAENIIKNKIKEDDKK